MITRTRVAAGSVAAVVIVVLAIVWVRSLPSAVPSILPGVDWNAPVTGIEKQRDSVGTCCWLRQTASFRLRVPRGAASIWLALYVPESALPQQATVYVDDNAPYHVRDFTAGAFFVDVPLGAPRRESRTSSVRIAFDRIAADGDKIAILAGVGTDVYQQ